MSWSGRVHFDEELVPRKPVRIVGTCVDTTQRLEAEARLRASEARLTSEAQALTKLNTLSSRLWRTDSLQEGLEEMLAVTIGCLGPTFGGMISSSVPVIALSLRDNKRPSPSRAFVPLLRF